MSQSGRKRIDRKSPFERRMQKEAAAAKKDIVPEGEIEEEIAMRMQRLDHTDLYSADREYVQACKEVEALTKKEGKYSTREKLRAAMAYTLTASAVKASKICGVPDKTIRYWREQASWWPTAVAYALEARNEEWDAKFSEVVSLALDHTIEALKEGESKIVKYKDEYEIVKLPMTAKDAMLAMSMAREKQSLMRGEPTRISETKKSDEQIIGDIADKIAKAVKDSGKVIEGMVIKPNEVEKKKK